MGRSVKPRISLVTLGVTSMERSRAFYERLGFVASSASNADVTFFDANGIVLGLFSHDALAEDAKVPATPPPQFRGASLAWNAESENAVNVILDHARTVGALILKPAEKVSWGGYSGYFADPDGHLWEVAHNPLFPLDPSGRLELP